jgi:gliding motility-associated lipoprotein GldH
MLRFKFFIVFVFSLAMFSCDRSGVFEENINTKDYSWNENEIAKFGVKIADTLLYHNIFINVRNTTDYQNCNLFLFITTKSPAGYSVTDTLECFLADEQGNWLGKGFGFIRDNRIPYKHNVRFPKIGEYKIEIRQAMRTDDLKGIASVGVRIEKSNVK